MKRPLLTALERDIIRTTNCKYGAHLQLHLSVLRLRRDIDIALTPVLKFLVKILR